jgi:probable phosphoglycerate mutase
MQLMVLRHGATAWNRERLIQGRADPPLSAEGRAEVATWSLSDNWLGLPCFVSPLRRAIETATVLGFTEPVAVPELVEMAWGAFEGRKLEQLRADLGAEMAANEAAGLDFRPPGGESPRDVIDRLQPWLARLGGKPGAAVVVTHKGVRRALLSSATGWKMHGPAPVKLRDQDVLCLNVDASGMPSLGGVVSMRSA